MGRCKCGSYAINHHLHGRNGDTLELCDVCFWIKKYNEACGSAQSLYNSFVSICSDDEIESIKKINEQDFNNLQIKG
jgi:hypothetical protein